jgi:hypothetical protein
MLFRIFYNFVLCIALVAYSTSTPTPADNNITPTIKPTIISNNTALLQNSTDETNGKWLSNEDVLKIQLARRHVIRTLHEFDVSKIYTNAIAIIILRDALDLPIFMEKISPSNPLLQKLKQEKEASDNNPQASLLAVCNFCGGKSISTCRCAKEAQRKHREEYYNIE